MMTGSSLQHLGFPTPKHHATEGRTSPSKEVIVMMEKIAAGEGTAASTGASTSPKFVLDRYICAMARFPVACSARFKRKSIDD
jgi:hypothetical protein